MFYVIIVLVILILISSIYSLFFGIKSPDKYLKNKYKGIDFKFVSNYDSGKDWKSFHYKDSNDENVIVTCNKKYCRDNYYGIYNRDKINTFIHDELRKISSLSVEYKYGNAGNNSTANENVTLDTPITEVTKIDNSYRFTGPIDIYVKNEIVLKEEDFKVFKDCNINVNVYLISEEDFNLLDVDCNDYIYDYIVRDDISVGTNSKYANLITRSKKLLSN